jgi:hypothetical protein
MSLRSMKNPWLRFAMGPWILVTIFFAAILFGMYFFIFHASEVPAPLSQQGARLVANKAADGARDLRTILTSANGSIDALGGFSKKLTELISGLPELIVAIGILFAALRKLIVR